MLKHEEDDYSKVREHDVGSSELNFTAENNRILPLKNYWKWIYLGPVYP